MIALLLIVLVILIGLATDQLLIIVATRRQHGGLVASWRVLREQNAEEFAACLMTLHKAQASDPVVWQEEV